MENKVEVNQESIDRLRQFVVQMHAQNNENRSYSDELHMSTVLPLMGMNEQLLEIIQYQYEQYQEDSQKQLQAHRVSQEKRRSQQEDYCHDLESLQKDKVLLEEQIVQLQNQLEPVPFPFPEEDLSLSKTQNISVSGLNQSSNLQMSSMFNRVSSKKKKQTFQELFQHQLVGEFEQGLEKLQEISIIDIGELPSDQPSSKKVGSCQLEDKEYIQFNDSYRNNSIHSLSTQNQSSSDLLVFLKMLMKAYQINHPSSSLPLVSDLCSTLSQASIPFHKWGLYIRQNFGRGSMQEEKTCCRVII